MDTLTLGYVTGTTIMFLYLAIIWGKSTHLNVFLKLVFYLNAFTGTILLFRYFVRL